MNKYDKKHLQNLQRYEQRIAALFAAAAQDAANLAPLIGALGEAPFSWSDYPLALAKIKEIIAQLNSDVQAAIVNGVRSEWTLSNNKNDELCRMVFGSLATSLPEAAARRYFSTNEAAREAFIVRRTNGLNLSDNVWNYTNQFKGEIELALDTGIRSGRSADEISRDVRDYLKHPDKLFRRVRDEHGQLHLSRRASEFHPGQGVYRSSYMNARRLAATETNIAYRTADHLRWQELDFVVGIEIHLSNNHNCKGVPSGMYFDICDQLKGKYPKDFEFTGWHPHCRCYATSILKTEEEMAADNARILAGEDIEEGGENQITELPDNFKQWLADNEERLGRAKSVPYFIKDNPQYKGVTPRMAGMEGFEGTKLGRTATKAAMQEYAGGAPTVLTKELQTNIREAAASFGTTATPMTFIEANEGRANIDFSRSKAFKDNCQACVLIHEARLRGLNITALGYDPTEGSWSKLLGDNPSLGFLRQDGSVPQHTLLRGDSAGVLLSKLEKQTKGGRKIPHWRKSAGRHRAYHYRRTLAKRQTAILRRTKRSIPQT